MSPARVAVSMRIFEVPAFGESAVGSLDGSVGGIMMESRPLCLGGLLEASKGEGMGLAEVTRVASGG